METAADVVDAAASLELERSLAEPGQSREEVARSPWLGAVAARQLAAGAERGSVLVNLAGNRSCPPDLLSSLTDHPYPSVSYEALRNPRCPYPVVASRLSAAELAAHPDCGVDVLLEALAVEELRHRCAAAAHPNLPTGVRSDLAATGPSRQLGTLLTNPS